MSTTLMNQGQPSTSISVFDAAPEVYITASRQPKALPATSSKGINALQRVSMSADLKDLVTMKMSSRDTAFFALSRRVSPVVHLQNLRGAQNEPLLHTDEFMSPGLHNSSDTYHRHLRSQLFYSKELCQGLHQRKWLRKIQERKSFIDFMSHLDCHSCAFLHGYHNQRQKEEDEQSSYDEKKDDYLLKESEGMEKRGWKPEDWDKIQRAIVQEDMLAVCEMDLDRSYDSIETAVSSVFDDDEKDEDTVDDDEFDHIYSFDDGKPVARRTSDEEATIADLEQELQPTLASENGICIQQTTNVKLSIESTKEYTSCNRRMDFTANAIKQYYQAKKPLIDISFEDLAKGLRVEVAKQTEPNMKQKLECKKSLFDSLSFISTDDTNYKDSNVETSTTLGRLYQTTNQSSADLFISPTPLQPSPFNLDGIDYDESDEGRDEEDSEEEDSEEDDEDESDEDDEDESDEDDEDESDEDDESRSTSNSPPSRLLSSVFCLNGDDYDSDEEDDQKDYDKLPSCSPSPPASLYLDSSAVLDTEFEVGETEISPARRRQYKFLADLQSVRTQANLDMEAEAEHKAFKAIQKQRKQDFSYSTSKLAIYLVSLRLHMFLNSLFPVKRQEKIHFRCSKAVGKHEVEFKGALRDELMDKAENRLGSLVERAFWDAKKNGDWAREIENDQIYALLRGMPHLTAKAGDSEAMQNEMKDVVRMAQQLQQCVQWRARQAIEHAIWADEKMLSIDIAEVSVAEIA